MPINVLLYTLSRVLNMYLWATGKAGTRPQLGVARMVHVERKARDARRACSGALPHSAVAFSVPNARRVGDGLVRRAF